MKRDSLRTYNKKRNFLITPEPSGELTRKPEKKLQFVIQKHDATRLHYDFRLEMEGVLKSWAVPKGPSLDPADKRLAVRTEDHPLSYADFEGIIPEKQYGAGPVMVWDKGEWISLEKDPVKALKKGKITFQLKGEKLHGQWTLTRMHQREGEKGENWLLIKHHDAEAKSSKTFLQRTDYSAKTGRSFKEISKSKPKDEYGDIDSLLKKYKGVQLATLVAEPPTGKEWLHEVKYDGYRIFAFVNDDEVVIRTRNGNDWTNKFSLITSTLANNKAGTFVLDGEAVVIDEAGLSDFKGLQNAFDNPDIPIRAYFFDLLYWNGEDYTSQPLKSRRKALANLLKKIPSDNVIFISEAIQGKANEVIKLACRWGLEGVVSKHENAEYIFSRSKTWLKSKCIKKQEFIICGFVPATDRDNSVGALHLGYYKKDVLVYAGKVGTGYTAKSAAELFARLQPLVRDENPFPQKFRSRNTVWVEPKLLCEVKFVAWTESGKVRHASYQGLREDKKASAIIKEVPKKLRSKDMQEGQKFENVIITHPERVVFPESKVTKLELAEFYFEMADFILPQIRNRLISIVRCPGGLEKKCFFQRGKGQGMPAHIFPLDVKHDGKIHDYMYIKERKGLIELVQMSAIEIHPWGSRIDKVNFPDRLIFDLDPDDDVPFDAVKLAVKDIKRRFDKLGLESFLKVTGGKGFHITVPIARKYDWATIKTFTHNFARQMEQDVPEAYVTNMAKKKRAGKIFIDYLRNDFAATAVMDYCVRSKPNSPVAIPLEWNELDEVESAGQFSIKDALTRKKQAKKLLAAYQDTKQFLNKTILQSFI